MKGKQGAFLLVTAILGIQVGCIAPQDNRTTQPATAVAASQTLAMPQSTQTQPSSKATTTHTPATTIKTSLPNDPSISPIKKIEPGEYVFYKISEYDSDQNKIVSWLKLKSVNLMSQSSESILNINNHNVSISSNFLIVLPQEGYDVPAYLIDLNSNEKISLPEMVKENCQSLDVFQKDNYIASCDFNNSIELYLWSSDSKTLIKITDCSLTKEECSSPQISPNGKWVAYYRKPQGGLQSRSFGLYIMPTSCFAKIDNCESQSKGPFEAFGIYSWSPNNKYLATNLNNKIRIYSVGENSLENHIDLNEISSYCEISWAPDSNRIIYSQDWLYEYSLTNKSVLPIQGIDPNACIVNWIRITQ
jgi:hypothetical protein